MEQELIRTILSQRHQPNCYKLYLVLSEPNTQMSTATNINFTAKIKDREHKIQMLFFLKSVKSCTSVDIDLSISAYLYFGRIISFC